MKKLFLDDYRNPPDSSWDVVRNYKEFCAYLDNNGLPDVVSFDHDLADEHYEMAIDTSPRDKPQIHWLPFDYDACTEKTGMHCARYMLEKYGLPKKWYVHSANPVGKTNIEGLLKSYENELLRHSLERKH